MNLHREIQSLLYEFYRGELPEAKHRQVREHLATCERCSKTATEIQELVNVATLPSTKPSDERPEQFWNSFALHVIDRVRREEQRKHVRKISLGDYLQSVFVHQRRTAVALGVGLAIVSLILLTWQLRVPLETAEQRAMVAEPEGQTAIVHARLGQYLRKSQTLMVGLMNMKSENNGGLDLSTERAVSRELIHEARYLTEQDIDERAKQLVNDLKRILIELSNIEGRYDLPDVEILRAGIEQENLLFKLRMGEQLYAPAPTEQRNSISPKGESL
ncbi:MAG: zf-HC2 domain-containing protein [Bacteroidota bacterium]